MNSLNNTILYFPSLIDTPYTFMNTCTDKVKVYNFSVY